ncbi:uncharacterized protein A4U43_C05F21450 [Asparagus officinalis]|uniref:Uncharacterized protein n=1 Tax=Asparagus officinalis TaxID=4686 RepID=A0A5P1EU14_ASPOF|nr:uncharacterized protein A4U43_C05F21450 [Asparagus officinalis]
MMTANAAKFEAQLVGPSAPAQAERSEKRRRSLNRGQGPHASVEPALAESAEAAKVDVFAPSPKVSSHSNVIPSKHTKIVIINEASPSRPAGGEEVAEHVEVEVRVEEHAA